MATAIDTNVIVALWNEDDTLNRPAQQALETAQVRGPLVICGPVYAELLAAPGRAEPFVDEFCAATAISVEWELGQRVWKAAGTAFGNYAVRRRKHKGAEPRRILADFLIGAHALLNGYKLLTLDASMYRASFPRLAIATP